MVGLGLADVSDTSLLSQDSEFEKRGRGVTHHNVGGLDPPLSDMRGDKLRHSPLSKMDMEAAISLFLPLL